MSTTSNTVTVVRVTLLSHSKHHINFVSCPLVQATTKKTITTKGRVTIVYPHRQVLALRPSLVYLFFIILFFQQHLRRLLLYHPWFPPYTARHGPRCTPSSSEKDSMYYRHRTPLSLPLVPPRTPNNSPPPQIVIETGSDALLYSPSLPYSLHTFFNPFLHSSPPNTNTPPFPLPPLPTHLHPNHPARPLDRAQRQSQRLWRLFQSRSRRRSHSSVRRRRHIPYSHRRMGPSKRHRSFSSLPSNLVHTPTTHTYISSSGSVSGGSWTSVDPRLLLLLIGLMAF